MIIQLVRKIKPFIYICFLVVLTFFSSFASAAIAIGATRAIYLEGQKQIQLAVTNNDSNGVFLIQSWIDDNDSVKSDKFLVTPPLFTIKGKKENTIRIIGVANDSLPRDKESVFWINVKAIPSIDKNELNENVLQFAIINRIKLFYRPKDLPISPVEAFDKLVFNKVNGDLFIKNDSPYHITLTELKSGSDELGNLFIPPMSERKIALKNNHNKKISWRAINDYGALTPIKEVLIN